MGANLVVLHHIGSTAVPGLPAKPTIDILAEVQSHDALEACIPELAAMGYQAKGENGVSGRRYFHSLSGEVHLFHLHAYEIGHADIRRHLDFRDYLRAHPDTARAYAALKHSLAAEYPYDPQLYTAGKSDFIRGVDRKAAAWRAARENRSAAQENRSAAQENLYAGQKNGN
jgi:GrpB-like predicted nucleotidyltransferase (UPF0157 family)